MGMLLAVLALSLAVNSAWMAAWSTSPRWGSLEARSGSSRGVMWAHYYGRFGLGRVQGSAMMITITGAAIGPFPLAVFRDFTGTYQAGIIAMATLPALSIVVLLLARPDRLDTRTA